MTTRVFTPEEDLMIIEHSKGGMTLFDLEKTLHTGRLTLERRARELNVVLLVKGKRFHPLKRTELYRKVKADEEVRDVHYADHGDSFRLSEYIERKEYDLWREAHGDRLYASLKMKEYA